MSTTEIIHKGFAFILITTEGDIEPSDDIGNSWIYLFEARAELFVITDTENEKAESFYTISYMVNPHEYTGVYVDFVGTGYRVYPRGSIFGSCSAYGIRDLEEAKRKCIAYRDRDVEKLIREPLEKGGVIEMFRRLASK